MDTAFRWDNGKAAENLRKHGVSFEQAWKVFDDPSVLVIDNYLVDGEQRMQAIGMIGLVMLVAVIFVERREPDTAIVHLISARKATAYEQTLYGAQGKNH